MDVSIVIPLYNESESLVELNEWINKSFTSSGFSYEIIYIDDGSDDQSWNIIEGIAKENNYVKGISFSKNFGKSQALRVGFYESKGDYVATLDADLQDSPEEIPIMIDKLSLKKDSGGAGFRRGGLGYDKEIRLLEECRLISNADRSILGCYGVNGGLAGNSYNVSVIRENGEKDNVV